MRVVLLLLLAALAGCVDDVSRTGSHEHGTYHTCPDGARLDPGSFPDHHQEGFDISSKCPEAGEAARVGLEMPAQGVAYEEIRIEWDITPARGHHTAGTEVRVSFGGQVTVVAKEGSSMIPRTFSATWMPLEPGTYAVQAWATVEGEQVSSREAAFEVAEAERTGVVHDIAIKAGGPVSKIEPVKVWIQPGDTVRWVNEDVVAQRIVLDGPERTEVEIEAQGSHRITLFRLGLHEYTVENPTFHHAASITVEL